MNNSNESIVDEVAVWPKPRSLSFFLSFLSPHSFSPVSVSMVVVVDYLSLNHQIVKFIFIFLLLSFCFAVKKNFFFSFFPLPHFIITITEYTLDSTDLTLILSVAPIQSLSPISYSSSSLSPKSKIKKIQYTTRPAQKLPHPSPPIP